MTMIRMKNIKTQEISWIDEQDLNMRKKEYIMLIPKYKLSTDLELIPDLIKMRDKNGK